MLRPSSLPLLLLLSVVALSTLPSNAFTVSGPPVLTRGTAAATARCVPTLLQAKKKRRRKNASETESDSDLPDFDLGEGGSDGVAAATTPKRTSADGMDKISDNMMGSTNSRSRSVRELINDRSLEKAFEFDPEGDDALPNLSEIAADKAAGGDGGSRSSDASGGTGSKRARQDARRAAAKASEPAAEEESFLEKIPFIIKDENGKVTPIKLLENGTWAGIYLLVGWEVYLNSPLFDRAAPMVPVVYDLVL